MGRTKANKEAGHVPMQLELSRERSEWLRGEVERRNAETDDGRRWTMRALVIEALDMLQSAVESTRSGE